MQSRQQRFQHKGDSSISNPESRPSEATMSGSKATISDQRSASGTEAWNPVQRSTALLESRDSEILHIGQRFFFSMLDPEQSGRQYKQQKTASLLLESRAGQPPASDDSDRSVSADSTPSRAKRAAGRPLRVYTTDSNYRECATPVKFRLQANRANLTDGSAGRENYEAAEWTSARRGRMQRRPHYPSSFIPTAVPVLGTFTIASDDP